MAGGAYVGSLERDGDLAVVLNDAADKAGKANDGKDVNLDILVMQIGRSNFGNLYDLKGLVSGTVLINSALPAAPDHFHVRWDFRHPLQNNHVSDKLLTTTVIYQGVR